MFGKGVVATPLMPRGRIRTGDRSERRALPGTSHAAREAGAVRPHDGREGRERERAAGSAENAPEGLETGQVDGHPQATYAVPALRAVVRGVAFDPIRRFGRLAFHEGVVLDVHPTTGREVGERTLNVGLALLDTELEEQATVDLIPLLERRGDIDFGQVAAGGEGDFANGHSSAEDLVGDDLERVHEHLVVRRQSSRREHVGIEIGRHRDTRRALSRLILEEGLLGAEVGGRHHDAGPQGVIQTLLVDPYVFAELFISALEFPRGSEHIFVLIRRWALVGRITACAARRPAL